MFLWHGGTRPFVYLWEEYCDGWELLLRGVRFGALGLLSPNYPEICGF